MKDQRQEFKAEKLDYYPFAHIDPPRFALPKQPRPAGAGLVLFSCSFAGTRVPLAHKRKTRSYCCGFFVARPGFEPRHTEPKSVVLPLYYQAIRPILLEWAAKIGLGVNCSKFFNLKFLIFFRKHCYH